MPGGAKEAWPHIKTIFQSIAAKSASEPCCEWVKKKKKNLTQIKF